MQHATHHDQAADGHTDVEDAAAELVAEHPALTIVGRAGWLAKGIVYVVAGLLAVLVALAAFGWPRDTTGRPGEAGSPREASPTGALKTVAEHSLGAPLLIGLAVGLVVYACWRIVSAAMPGERTLPVLATRVGYVVSAVMYATFAYTALKLVFTDPASTDGNSTVSDVTASVMRHTGGRIAIGLVGAILGGVAIYRADKGRRADVADEMSLAGMSARRVTWIKRLGAAGEIGRGLALALVGFFLVRAAVTYDASQATGLDGALRRATEHTWTRIVVPVVALGFVAYGVFCLATFRRRRFEAPG